MKIGNKTRRAVLNGVLTLVASLVLLTSDGTSSAWAAGTESRSETKKMSASQFDRWRRSELRKLKALMDTDTEAIGWGKQRKATRSTVIVLNPPLPKLSGPDKVDVEIFYTYLDEVGRGIAFTGSMILWSNWGRSLIREDKESYRLIEKYEQIIGNGPKVPTRYARQQRSAQELHYGAEWYRADKQGDEATGWKVLKTLVTLGEAGLFNMQTKEALDKVVKSQGIPLEEWKKKTSSYVEKRGSEADSRWAQIVERGTQAYSKAFDGLSDPILLINGKFLITRNTMARQGGRNAVKWVYQTANWIIREEVKKIPEKKLGMGRIRLKVADSRRNTTATERRDLEKPGMPIRQFRRWEKRWDRHTKDLREADAVRYAWGNEKRAVQGKIIVLDPPLEKRGSSDKVVVEWFHTPLDERGTREAWVNSLSAIQKWSESMREAGEKDVDIMPRIIGVGLGLPKRFNEQRRLIQDSVLAWKGNPLLKTPSAKAYLGLTRTERNLAEVATPEEMSKLLEETGMMGGYWLTLRKAPSTRDKRVEADARYNEIMKRAARIDQRILASPQGPIFVIEGRYLLTGYLAKSTTDLFRMANWIIQRELRHARTD